MKDGEAKGRDIRREDKYDRGSKVRGRGERM